MVMKILFAAPENAWGGFLNLIQSAVPEHEFKATGGFHIDTLAGYDVLIPTMTTVTRETLKSCDRLKLIQQCGSGLELVDIDAAVAQGIRVANVPTDISGNADSVAEVGIYTTSRGTGGRVFSHLLYTGFELMDIDTIKYEPSLALF